MAYLVQSKLDNQFPTWKEASGARDTFPSGAYPYLFGGAFSKYLQDTYGMEKYAELWEVSNSGKYILTSSMFNNVYNEDIKNRWENFEMSIPVTSVS